MWKTQLNKAIKEVRFVLKISPEHHGVWRFLESRLNELVFLNPSTFFSSTEINHHFKTPSKCHLIYGDLDNTFEAIDTAGVSCEEFEKLLKAKVEYGLTLRRNPINSNYDRELPLDIVESYKYVKYMDDGF